MKMDSLYRTAWLPEYTKACVEVFSCKRILHIQFYIHSKKISNIQDTTSYPIVLKLC